MNRNSPSKVVRNVSRELSRWKRLLVPGTRAAPRKRRKARRRPRP